MKTERTPFILLILKLPFWLIKLVLSAVGFLVCFPIYGYCLLSNSFLFNPNFETNQRFYLAFCIPRALTSAGTFAVVGGELYLLTWLINKSILFNSKLEVIITLSSIIIFIAVSLRFGYHLLQSIFNFPKLKGFREYFTLAFYGVQDIFAGLLTILVLSLGFRAKEVFRYKLAPNQRRYLRFILSKFFESLLDLICLPFWIILGLTVWRLFYTIREFEKTKSEGKKRFLVVYQGISAVLDLLFIPPLLIGLVNPFLKGRRLINHMKILSVQSWRRLILDEFFSTLVDCIPFLFLLLSSVSIYGIPMAYTLYKAILRRTQPFVFDEHAEELGKLEEDSQILTDMNQKVHSHNITYERKYRNRCLILVVIIVVDIIILVGNTLLMLSIYRKLIIQKKIKAKKLETIQSSQNKEDLVILTYSEHRRYIYNFISMDNHKLLLFSYPLMIISEVLYLLLDIPVIAVCPFFIFVPWRGLSVKAAVQKEWIELENVKANDDNFSIRSYILSEILMGVLDYVCILLFLVSLLGIWRSKEMYSHLKTILQSSIYTIGSKHLLFAIQVINSIVDVVFIPLFFMALANPFLKGRKLINDMRKTPGSGWRSLILEEFVETIKDILPFLCIILSFGIVYELPVAMTLYKVIVKQTGISSDEKSEPLIDNQYESLKKRNIRKGYYRNKCFALIPLIFLDLIVFLSNTILAISLYRFIILQKRAKAIKLADLQNKKKVSQILTYADYRHAIYDVITREADISESGSRLSNYALLLLKEIFRLLLDIPIIIISPVLIIIPWRAKHVYDAAHNGWNNLENIDSLHQKLNLRSYVLSEIVMGLIDYVCILFFLISVIIIWRSKHMYRELRAIMQRSLSNVGTKQFEFILEALNCFIDVLYIPLFIVALINPFLKAKRLLAHMSFLPVTTWRSLIFAEFVRTIVDIAPFLCFLLSSITIYEAPVAISLYHAILKKTQPLNFDDEMQALLKANPDKLLYNLEAHNERDEIRYRARCFTLPFLAVVDSVSLLLTALLRLSVYRYAIFQQKISRKKLARITNKAYNKREVLTYSEYRNNIFGFISMQHNESMLTLLSYQIMLFEEIISFIIDVPIIIVSLVLILFPWRAKRVIQVVQNEWKKLKNIEDSYEKFSLRSYILSEILMGILDYICILVFITTLISAWRFKQMYNALKLILQSRLSNVEDKHLNFLVDSFKALVDIFYIPPFLIALCNPFFKGRRLVHHMKALPGHIWWKLIKDEFTSTVMDILPFLFGLLSCITVVEAPMSLFLYKDIIEKTRPFSFANLTETQLRVEANILYEKINVYNTVYEETYRIKCLALIPLALLDLLTLIMNMLLRLTIYRFVIFQHKINAFTISKGQKTNQSAWTYSQYRTVVYNFISLESANNDKVLNLSSYPELLVRELCNFIIDIPIIASCVILILIPWRAKRVLNKIKEEWRRLQVSQELKQELSLRRYILSEILMGIIDYICILFFLLTSWIVWRTKQMWKELTTITNSSLLDIKDKQILFISTSVNNMLDVFFIPPFLITLLNPFLKGRRMISHMTEMSVTIWRRLIIDELISTLLDIPSFLCLGSSALTLFESNVAWGLYKSIMQKTMSFSFQVYKEDKIKLEADALYEKVSYHNQLYEADYRIRCFLLLPLILMDVLVLIGNALLTLTIYRRLILNKKVATLSLVEMKKDEIKRVVLTYSHHRVIVYDTIVTNDEKSDRILSYPLLILSEVVKFLLDIPVIAISLTLLLFPWRGKHVYQRAEKEWQKLEKIQSLQDQCYLRSYILSEILMGVLDYICILFFLASSMIIWRSKKIQGDLKVIMQSSLSEVGFKQLKFVFKTLDSLLDIIFIPPFLISLLNPFLKGKRLMSHMSALHVDTWRRLIIAEFVSTLVDIGPFLCLLLSIFTLYEIPLALSFYRAILQKTKPFIFVNQLEEEKDITILLQKVVSHNHIYENGIRFRCIMLVPIALIDAVVLTGNLLLYLSLYRHTTLKRKALEILKDDNAKRKSLVTYAAYRELIKDVLCNQLSLAQNISIIMFYPKLILSELIELLLDLPIIVICPLFILAPWRGYYAVEAAHKVWKTTDKNENAFENFSLRKYVFTELIKGIFDYLCFAMFLVYMLAFWRYKFIFSEIKAILNSNFESMKKSESDKIETKMDAFALFCISNLHIFITDFIFIPITLPLLPFYGICFWRIKLLRKCLNILELNDFSAHRKVLIQIGLICTYDFLKIIPLLFTYLTLYRVSTLYRMIRSVNEHKANQKRNPEVENNRLIKCNILISDERDILLFTAGIKCSTLLILDIISLPLFVAIYVDYSYLDEYRDGIKSFQEKRKILKTITGHYDNEGEIISNKLYFGGFSVIDIFAKICGLVITVLLMWRGPTLIILILKKQLKYQLYTIEKLQGPPKKKSELEKYGPVIIFCFKHLFVDLLELPYFLAQIVLTPWRSLPIFKQMYRYDEKTSINAQMNNQRQLLREQLRKGIEDVVAIFQFATTIFTIIRVPFLFMVLLKNIFPNSWLSTAIFRRKEIINDNNRYIDPNTRLSLKKCIILTYRELVLDFDYILCVILLIILAPWRVFNLYHMFINQLQTIPTRNSEVKALKRSSSRDQVSIMLRSIFNCDYANLFKIINMILTLYKIPKVVSVIINYIMNSGRYYSGELSFSRELEKEARKGKSTSMHVVLALIILICVFRVKNTISRVKRYLQNVKKDKEPNIKKGNNDQHTKENTLIGLKWNIYSQISQFLTPGDLARLSQVNRSLYVINQNDAYWQYQADRDLSAQEMWNDESSFKERCIRAAQEKKERRKKQPLSQQQLDMLYGLNYILLDETVQSLCSIPQMILLPFNTLSYLLRLIFRNKVEFLDFFEPKNNKFIDMATSTIYNDYWRSASIVSKFEQIHSFKNIHFALPGFLAVFCLKYISELGYVLAYVAINIFKETSAGEVSPMNVRINPAPKFIDVQFLKEKKDLAETPNKFFRFLLHVAQCLVLLIGIVLLIIIILAPGWITYYYANWTFTQAIIGPFGLFIIHYAAVINAVITLLVYIRRGMPYFKPHRAFIDPLICIQYLAQKTWLYIVNAARKVYSILQKGALLVYSWLKIVAGFIEKIVLTVWRVLVRGTHYILFIFKLIAKVSATAILFVWRSIVQGIKYLGKGIKGLTLFIVKQILSAGKGSYQSYIGILLLVTKSTLKFGLLGDIILTPFALVWMLWPLLVGYFVQSKIYFIPCSLVSVVLVFIGYRKIQQVAKPYPQHSK